MFKHDLFTNYTMGVEKKSDISAETVKIFLTLFRFLYK